MSKCLFACLGEVRSGFCRDAPDTPPNGRKAAAKKKKKKGDPRENDHMDHVIGRCLREKKPGAERRWGVMCNSERHE